MVIVLALAVAIMEAVVAWGVWLVDPVPGSPAAMMGVLVTRIVVALMGQLFVAAAACTIWFLARRLQARRCRQNVNRE